jgi:hypothetical protein
MKACRFRKCTDGLCRSANAALGCDFSLGVGDMLLQGNSTGDCIDHRAELNDGPIAHQLDDAIPA